MEGVFGNVKNHSKEAVSRGLILIVRTSYSLTRFSTEIKYFPFETINMKNENIVTWRRPPANVFKLSHRSNLNGK